MVNDHKLDGIGGMLLGQTVVALQVPVITDNLLKILLITFRV